MKTYQTDLSLEQHRIINLRGGVMDNDVANCLQAEHSKSISVLSPQDGDDIVLFYTRYAITVQEVATVLRGSGGPSVLFSIRHSTDRSAVGTTVVNAGTASSTTIGNTPTLNDTTIPAYSWVWMEIGTLTGAVDEFHLTLFFRIDP